MDRSAAGLIGLGVAVVLLSADPAPSASVRSWSLVEARKQLLAAQPFAVVDVSQADRPVFRIDVERAAPSSVNALGAPTLVRGVRRWRSFRFTGPVEEIVSGIEPTVSFLFSPGSAGGMRVRDFRGPPANRHEPTLPVRGAFYYGWFPELWSAGGIAPYTRYRPSLGLYSSGDPRVLRNHVAAMRYGGFDVGIWSWWGIGEPTDLRFPTALDVARPTPFRWAVYYEDEGYGDPSPEQIRSDLEYIRDRYGSKPAYLRLGGRVVVFVYSADDVDCEVAERWSRANPGGLFIVLKVFGGYSGCPAQPDGWHQYGADFATGIDRQTGYGTTIMPGFWFVEHPSSLLSRDLTRWRQTIRDMVAGSDPFQLVVSFNEWGEGSAVESAVEWESSSGYGAYLDVLHEELGMASQAARARRSSTVDPSSVSRRSKRPAQRDDRSGTASRLAAVASPSSARTSTASSR